MITLQEKQRFVEARCRGKTVLDVGCVDHDLFAERLASSMWLHARIAQVAEAVYGVDADAEGAARLRPLGYDIRVGDAERLDLAAIDLNRVKFDVIVAADLLEHLANPGLFLDAARAIMRASEPCELIITVPNCFVPSRLRDAEQGFERVRPDHMCWYSHNTLNQLLSSRGLSVAEDVFSLVEKGELRLVKSRVRWPLRRLLGRASLRIVERLVVVARVSR